MRQGNEMEERRVAISELQSSLGECLREVAHGTTLLVTDQERQVARITPETDATERTLARLRASGEFLWSGRRLKKRKPSVRVRDNGTVSDIVIENRR